MNGVANTTQPLATDIPVARAAARRSLLPEYLLAFAAASIAIGILWDISWHSTVGRDTFWTAAHMAIYLGGSMGGFVGGWLAIKHTFLATPEEKAASVKVFGARAPIGAWVTIWGAIAMLASGPFDNWWHNAYGLDVKIISPPHVILAFGMMGICVGALLLAVSRQNREPQGSGGGIFVFVGGIFVVLGAVFLMEYSIPNALHMAFFYEVAALMFPFRLVAMARAGRISWPATRVALVYMGFTCAMLWILPLFPAQPKLAPIFNPVTHMVPPLFPLLLVFPAIGFDLVMRRAGENVGVLKGLWLSLVLGAIFLVVFSVAQWYFAQFLISHAADNWFFAGNRFWSFGNRLGNWRWEFWTDSRGHPDPITAYKIFLTWIFASASAWVGLGWGSWMRKVVR